MNRSLKTSGQTSADCSVVCAGDAGGLEVGARPRVDQRPAVARHPAGQTRARSCTVSCWMIVGFDAGGEPAAQRLAPRREEQRAARERHDVAQLRRDERHRVGDAEAGAHRLRDLVERVDLAVGERDVLEHRLLARRRSRRQADRRLRRRRVRRHARQRAAPAPGSLRLGVQRRAACSTNVCTTRGSSALPASCCSSADRRVDAHRLVIRPLRRQRVEVVDDRRGCARRAESRRPCRPAG